MLSWKIFSHYLLSHRSGALIRTIAWVCIVGIAVAVMALIIVLGVMNGFNDVIRERHLRIQPHLVIQLSRKQESQIPVLEDKVRHILGKRLSEITPYETEDVILKTMDGLFTGAVAKGLSKQGYYSLMHRIQEGSKRMREREKIPPFDPSNWKLKPGEAVMGMDLANSLRLIEGDEITVISPEALLLPPDEAPTFAHLRIAHLVTTELEGIDDKMVFYIRGQSLQSLKQSASREIGIQVRLHNGEDFAGPRHDLRAAGFKVQAWPDRNAALFFALKMEKLVMTVFLSLSALITSFSILTVLVLLITQKRKDIGMLLTMGLTPRKTRWIFTQVGLWLSLSGVTAGLILGVVICHIVNSYPLNILPAIYYDRTIPARVGWGFVATVFLASMVIAFLGSWFPSYFSARATPAEALRDSLRDV